MSYVPDTGLGTKVIENERGNFIDPDNFTNYIIE
jgi:hypothetical protein